MIAASRHWLRSFALWLALAVVLTCAIGSFGSPVRASSGSAFNAFTSDVAIGPGRAADPEKYRKEQTPTPGGTGQAKAIAAALAAVALPAPAVPQSYAEPASALVSPVTAGPLGARAPPLS